MDGVRLKNLREGVMTLISPESKRVTRLGMTPASTTHWIFSFGPSVRYDRAQQASAKTCNTI